jgi:hypothetical protein
VADQFQPSEPREVQEAIHEPAYVVRSDPNLLLALTQVGRKRFRVFQKDIGEAIDSP